MIKAGKKYQMRFFDHTGIRRKLTLFSDRAASDTTRKAIERAVSCRRAGEPLAPDILRAIDGLESRQLDALAEMGIIDPARAGRTLETLLASFRSKLEANERQPRYVRQTISEVESTLKAINARWPNDIDPDKVERFLAGRRQADTSARTINSQLKALRSFCRWLVETGTLHRDPLSRLKLLNAKRDRRLIRRALTPDECAQLIHAAENGITVYGLTGTQRATLYRLVLATGLRYSEARSLERRDFDLVAGLVHVRAETTKNGQDATLPLRPDVVDAMREHFDATPALPTARAFTMNKDAGSRMMRADLKRAGIPEQTEQGTIDFHGLRTTFISALANAGVHPSVAKTLARHSSITLTMDHYTRTPVESMVEAVNAIRVIKISEISQATGTDDEPLDVGQKTGGQIGDHQARFNAISCDVQRQTNTPQAQGENTKNPLKTSVSKGFMGWLPPRDLNPDLLIQSQPGKSHKSLQNKSLTHTDKKAGGQKRDQHSKIDRDLDAVVSAWASLPEHIKAAVSALIQSSKTK